MSNLRKYGTEPFTVAVIHGGPGAAGEMAPVAEKAAENQGVLEPFQTETSLTGQVEELKDTLKTHARCPVTLIGFSWGAWLSYLLTARYPMLVKKLILIGSPPFKEEYAGTIYQTRLSRLDQDESRRFRNLTRLLNKSDSQQQQTAFEKLCTLIHLTDVYCPIVRKVDPMACHADMFHSVLPDAPEQKIKTRTPALEKLCALIHGSDGQCYTVQKVPSIVYRADIFHSVWPDASKLRKEGRLLSLGRCITCPVTAIHGDYDPHPAAGVEKPLSAVLDDFSFILLKNCGHIPWIEKYAAERFFDILRQEIPSLKTEEPD